ncbi:MAG: hypothetical protein SGPRY_015014, partial [Prymnesium sp.]
DGCACAVLLCPTPQRPVVSSLDAIKPTLYGFESMIVPDTLSSLCYEWLDDYNKFSFTISPQARSDLPHPWPVRARISLTRGLDDQLLAFAPRKM